MMKRIIVVVAALAMVASACGSDDSDTASSGSAAATTAAPTTTAAPAPAEVGTAADHLGDGSLGEVRVGPGEEIQIRSLNAISGDVAFLGVPNQRGVELAVHDYGQIGGHDVTIGTGLDDLCSADGGQAAAQTIVADDDVVGVIGTSCSGAAASAAPLISEAGMVMISGSNTSPSLTSDLAGTAGENYYPGYYRTAHNDLYQGAAAAGFAIEVLGVTTAAAIHDGDPYTQGLAQAFADAFEGHGGTITTFTAVNKGDTDMVPVLTEVAAGSPEMLFFPIFQPEGDFIVQQASQVSGLENTTMMAADGLLNSNFMAIPESEGLYFSGPDIRYGTNTNQSTGQTADGFLAAYNAEWGEDPAAPFWAHSYDATTLLLDAIAAASYDDGGTLVIDRAGVREYMASVTNYSGIIGLLSCDAFGDCGSQKITVIGHADSGDIATSNSNVVYEYAPGGSSQGAGELVISAETTLNSSPDDGITDDTISVGWIGDLTGPTASAQAFNAHGSQAYFECSNADGGIFGRQWEFFAEDDGYNAEKSAIALTKLIEDEEILALVDLGGSGQAAQAIPELEAANVAVIGPPQTIDPTLGSGQFFHNLAAYGDQADIFVGEAAKKLGDASNAVVLGIVLEVPSGTEYATYVQDSVTAAGGTYVGTEYVGLRVQEATAQIIKLERAIDQYGVNMVALHGAPYHNELVLKAMSAAGITDIPVVGIHGVATNSIFTNSPEDVTDDTYGVHSFKTSNSDAAGASELKRCADLAGYPGEDLVNNFSHGFVNSYILHQAIVRAAEQNDGNVTRATLTKALQGKYDTMGLSCDIDWTTSNHNPCGAPFTMDRATGGMVQAGPFSDYAEFIDGVYGIDPVVFTYELAIGPPEVNEIGVCFAPTYTALMSKLLELKFSDSDLTYNNVSCASGPATAAALVANEVQIAVNTPDNMLGLRTAGFDVVMFMTGVSGSFWDVIVHKDIDLSSCDQGDWECNVKLMDGKTGGVVARGAAAEQFMRQLLESAGLDPENTTYVATGLAGTTLAALDSGEIDWSVTFEPAFALGTAMGHQTPFKMRAGELPVELDFPTIIYMTSSEFAANNPNVVQHYAADFEAAVCWALDPANEGELIEVMTGYLGLEADVAAGIHADSKAQWGGCDPMRGALDPVRIQNNVDYTVNRGIADEAASFEDFAIIIPNYGG